MVIVLSQSLVYCQNEGKKIEKFKSFDPYAILDIPEGATKADARAAFKVLALRWHPDKNPGDTEAAQRFLLINKAHSCFKTEETLEKCNNTGNPEGNAVFKVIYFEIEFKYCRLVLRFRHLCLRKKISYWCL